MKFQLIPEKYRLPLAAAVLCCSLLAAVFVAWSQRALASGYVVIGDGLKVQVEVASTAQTREKGLSGRDGLEPGQGMLFIFLRPDKYTFWMKDMKFPIDILWIRDSELVDISTDVPVPVPGEELPHYFPMTPADKVLEVPAGFARANGLKTGMSVTTHIDPAFREGRD